MSDPRYKAQEVKFSAWLQRNGQLIPIPVSSVTLTNTVDELPVANLTLGLDKFPRGDIQVRLDEINKHIAYLQNYLTTQLRTYPDLIIKVEDSFGNKLAFKGFLSKPSVSVADGNLAVSYAGVHHLAGMQAFSGGIYSISDFYGNDPAPEDKELTDEFFKPGENKDSIALRILAQWRKFQQVFKGASEEITKDLMEIHNLNETAMQVFIEPMLKASANYSIIPHSGTPPPGGEPIDIRQLNGTIARILVGSLNFWDAMPVLLNNFKMQLRPLWDGTAIFELLRTHDDPEGRFIRIAPENIAYEIFSTYELPLSRVYVRGPGSRLYAAVTPNVEQRNGDNWSVLTGSAAGQAALQRPDSLEGLLNVPDIIAWPPDVPSKKGASTCYIVSSPEWLGDDALLFENLRDTEDQSPMDIEGSVNAQEATKQHQSRQKTTRETLMRWVSKFEYEEHYLKYTQASVTTPFCAAVTTGKTYAVQNLHGDMIFIGYLATVRHHLSADPTNPAARTTMGFTHIKFPKPAGELKDKSLTLPAQLTHIKSLE